MGHFSIYQQSLFPSYTIDVKEQQKIDRFLTLLDKSNVALILQSVNSTNKQLGGRPSYSIYHMFSMVLYAFAFTSGTLRDMESFCRNDLRFLYIMRGEVPNYKTISNYINTYILGNIEEIFKAVNGAILSECGIDISKVYFDGTKIEADANKYKFVWKPTKFHEKLSDKIRVLLSDVGLGRGIQTSGIISTIVIAKKLSEISVILASSPENKELKKKYDLLNEYLQKALEYEEKERICGPNRNSYYKTDHDATAMTLKTDYYAGLGSNMHAAYNVQAVVSQGFVCAYYLSQSRNDIKDFIPGMEMYHKLNGCYPESVCADAGYGSLENYRFLKEHHIKNFVKYVSWEGNVSGRRPDSYKLNDDGSVTCLNGNKGHIVNLENRHPKREESLFYRVDGCNDCAFSTYCKRYQKVKDENFKIFDVCVPLIIYKQEGESNLLSIEGIEMRVNRSSQVEGSFGSLKNNMRYSRFRRISKERVTMEYVLTFLGYNIRKLFRYYSNNLKKDYWTAPDSLQPETFKNPSAKRLANKVNKKRSKSKNAEAKDSYKYK